MIGIGLAAGTGERAYPMSRRAGGIKSKATVPFLGRSTIKWTLDEFSAQNVKEYMMVVKGDANYEEIKRAISYGEHRGIRVRFSRPEDDITNAGSADALLTNLDRADITDTSLVFPVDSIYDLDWEVMYKLHAERGALITIVGFDCDGRDILRKYGMIKWNGDNRVTGFGEKPKTFEEIKEQYPDIELEAIPDLTLVASAGAYMVDSEQLRKIAASSDKLKAMRDKEFDIGKQLLPWLVEEGYPVFVFRASRYGDLGTPHDYLKTMYRCLAGEFESIERVGLGTVYDADRRLFIDETSLEMKDRETGKTLVKKLEHGDVVLGKNVRVGRYVEVQPGVELDDCNVSDDSTLLSGARAVRSELHERCLLGENASVTDSVLGLNTKVHSSPQYPTRLDHYVFIGDGASIGTGSSIYNNCIIAPGSEIRPGTRMVMGKISD